jgi:hypothetical protein
VWLAVGDYRGERIEANGSSADVAANYWADAVRFKEIDARRNAPLAPMRLRPQ